DTSSRFSALSICSLHLADPPLKGVLSAGLHLAVSGYWPSTTLRNPSYPRVIDATVQTQEAQTGQIALGPSVSRLMQALAPGLSRGRSRHRQSRTGLGEGPFTVLRPLLRAHRPEFSSTPAMPSIMQPDPKHRRLSHRSSRPRPGWS